MPEHVLIILFSELIMSWIILFFGWNFRPKGDGRSGPSGPLLPEKILNIFNMLNIEKGCLFWLVVILYLENCAIIMLPLAHIGNDFAILFRIAMEI